MRDQVVAAALAYLDQPQILRRLRMRAKEAALSSPLLRGAGINQRRLFGSARSASCTSAAHDCEESGFAAQ